MTNETLAVLTYSCKSCIVPVPNTAWTKFNENWWTVGFSNKLPDKPPATRSADPLGQPIPRQPQPNAGAAGAGPKSEPFDMTGTFTRAGYWARRMPNNLGGTEFGLAFAFACPHIVKAGLVPEQ